MVSDIKRDIPKFGTVFTQTGATELKNVCACAKLGRQNRQNPPKSAWSLVRADFLFCSFDVLFVWFLPRNGP